MMPLNCFYCKYCNKCIVYQGTKHNTIAPIVREYSCPPCNAFFFWELNPQTFELLDMIFEKLQTTINEQLFEVSIYHKENYSRIDSKYSPIMKDFLAFHGGIELQEIHLQFNCIIKVSPNNIEEKLRKYLIFT